MKARRTRSLIPLAVSDLTVWPAPDEHTFDDEKAAQYLRRKRAVQMYADGCKHDEIKKETSLSRQTVHKLVGRCLTAGADGRIAGFRALVPWHRVAGYERTKPVVREREDGSAGCAGALSLLFSQFPEVEYAIRSSFLDDENDGLPKGRMSYTAIHGEFLDLLRELGFTEHHWPFNTVDCGYKSIRAFCLKLRDEEPMRWFGTHAGEDAVRRHCVGSGFRSIFPELRGYAACQLDFHKVDAASVLIIETETGARLPVPVARWHIGFLVEERYHLILGAFAALESTPSGDSVLEIIDSSLRPNVSAGQVSCHVTSAEKVFPLQIMPELAFQGFSVLKMDNAWSNAATGVVDNIINTIGCAINFGPVKAWWRRNLIERIFGQLTQRGLQRMPSTFGSGPGDTRRSDPLGKAVKFEIEIKDVLDVIHGEIRENNSKVAEGIDFATPMQSLSRQFSDPHSGVFHQPIPRAAQDDFRLMCRVETPFVLGDRSKNVRPYVLLGRWRYTNPTLASSYDLIGQQIVAYCSLRDVQVVHATVLSTGEQLGQLLAPVKRRGQHISWRTRALINQSGLSLRNHTNHTPVVSDWRESKAASLRENKKLTKNRKRASKEALEVAKLQAEEERRALENQPAELSQDSCEDLRVDNEPVQVDVVDSPRRRRPRTFISIADKPVYLGD